MPRRMKNIECRLQAELRQFDLGFRLLLTGTPLQVWSDGHFGPIFPGISLWNGVIVRCKNCAILLPTFFWSGFSFGCNGFAAALLTSAPVFSFFISISNHAFSFIPHQNNVEEVFSLLHFMDPDRFDDQDAFMDKYGQCDSEVKDPLCRARHPTWNP
jgi:hypothetical protein